MKRNRTHDNIWTDECETLLAEWSEKASCYRWLHGRCEKSYKSWYHSFSIPVIILSTLTGAANVGMDSFVPEESKSLASAIVGGVNIFAGIVSTLQNFLKFAELMEGHRIAGVSWGKLQRNIAIELALDPNRRVIQDDFLKLSRAEYDRLIEAGPIIDDGVIKQFNNKFKNYQVSKPSICNGLDKCIVYKKQKGVPMDKNEFIDGIEDIVTNEEKSILNNYIDGLNDYDDELTDDKLTDYELTDDKLTDDKLTDDKEEIIINISLNECRDKDKDKDDIGKDDIGKDDIGKDDIGKEEEEDDIGKEEEEDDGNENITDFLDGIDGEP